MAFGNVGKALAVGGRGALETWIEAASNGLLAYWGAADPGLLAFERDLRLEDRRRRVGRNDTPAQADSGDDWPYWWSLWVGM